MAVMGLRLAARSNGVSSLHGEVSRDMFADLWPGVPEPEVPIGSVTNGVHGSTWVSAEIDELLRKHGRAGLGRGRGPRNGRSSRRCRPRTSGRPAAGASSG